MLSRNFIQTPDISAVISNCYQLKILLIGKIKYLLIKSIYLHLNLYNFRKILKTKTVIISEEVLILLG